MNCKLCGKEIKGPPPTTYVLNGNAFHLAATVHDECIEQWMAEERKRKPYRQPLDGFPGRNSPMPLGREIGDWE